MIQPVTYFLCRCCCSRAWLDTHLPNDWLAACWLLLWASAAATFISLILLLYEISRNDALLVFIMGTTLFECVACWIGSCYWVAGSYAEDIDATSDIESSTYSSSPQQKQSAALLNPDASSSSGAAEEPKKSWFFGWFSGRRKQTNGSNEALSTPFIHSADRGEF